MSASTAIEQGMLDLLESEQYGDLHTIDGVAVTCYLGPERREPDQVAGVYFYSRTLSAAIADLDAPAPGGTLIADDTKYHVGEVAAGSATFTAVLQRLA